jgi:hypothetical protein
MDRCRNEKNGLFAAGEHNMGQTKRHKTKRRETARYCQIVYASPWCAHARLQSQEDLR